MRIGLSGSCYLLRADIERREWLFCSPLLLHRRGQPFAHEDAESTRTRRYKVDGGERGNGSRVWFFGVVASWRRHNFSKVECTLRVPVFQIVLTTTNRARHKRVAHVPLRGRGPRTVQLNEDIFSTQYAVRSMQYR